MFSLHIDTARTWRGGQSQVMYTVTGLRARGQRTVLVAHPAGELGARMAAHDDLIRFAPRNEFDLIAAWRLAETLRALGPDLIHAHDPHGVAMASTALSMVPTASRPRLVASRRVEFHIGRRALSRWKYSKVDCFIANCTAVRDRLVEDGIAAGRTTIVNEGVDVARIAELPASQVRKEFDIPAQAPIICNVAALVPHKGQSHLVDAAAIVVRTVPDARFLIVGDGDLRQQLSQQIRENNLQDRVLLTGFRTDALELTKGCDLFVMSSVSEGMCTALVDAMAASKPAVATVAGGIPEVMVDGQTGFLVPPGDHQALADKLLALLTDRELRLRMGEAALHRARDRFGVDRMVDATARAYERVVRST